LFTVLGARSDEKMLIISCILWKIGRYYPGYVTLWFFYPRHTLSNYLYN